MKRLSPALFASIILLVCLGLVSIRQVVTQDSGESDALRHRIAAIEKQVEEARFRERLAQEGSRESQQLLAQYLPQNLKDKPKDATTYQLRQVASVLNSSDVHLGIERASGLLEVAKDEFRAKDFEGSNKKLQRLLREFPDSVHAPEARFLLAEGRFQVHDFEACIEVIEEMVRLYPESELTGFALLRLGKIYEIRDRLEDAADVYRSVTKNFSQPELRAQAGQALGAVDL